MFRPPDIGPPVNPGPGNGKKKQRIIIIDGSSDITQEEEQELIQKYLNQGYDLAFIRIVLNGFKKYRFDYETECYAIETISYPRYYFIK